MSETRFSSQPINLKTKGLGHLNADAQCGDVASQNWNILREDVSLPVAVLREERINHNLAWMRDFIGRYGLKLAPHGKTTMSPALFQRQLDYGAWGITLASASQVNAAFQCGVRRVIMANQLVGKANMAIISKLQREDSGFSFTCIVDSADNVAALGAFFSAQQQTLRILLEYGVAGGRTGIRNEQQEAQILAEIARWPDALALVGVEIYEGVMKDEVAIRTFLRHALSRTQALAERGLFAEPEVILTGAGSAWYDVVAQEFTLATPYLDSAQRYTLNVVLRPGCYLTHDVGAYKQANERILANNPVAREMNGSLLPALQVWAYVQSLPESGLAIVGLGKRDVAFDAGFPQAALHYRPGAALPPGVADSEWRIFNMMDQHAFMVVPANADIRVGDMLAFDVSHPCLTFDKWCQLLLVDEQFQVTDLVATWF